MSLHVTNCVLGDGRHVELIVNTETVGDGYEVFQALPTERKVIVDGVEVTDPEERDAVVAAVFDQLTHPADPDRPISVYVPEVFMQGQMLPMSRELLRDLTLVIPSTTVRQVPLHGPQLPEPSERLRWLATTLDIDTDQRAVLDTAIDELEQWEQHECW